LYFLEIRFKTPFRGGLKGIIDLKTSLKRVVFRGLVEGIVLKLESLLFFQRRQELVVLFLDNFSLVILIVRLLLGLKTRKVF
jgi:hypothetical protein